MTKAFLRLCVEGDRNVFLDLVSKLTEMFSGFCKVGDRSFFEIKQILFYLSAMGLVVI